jgi:hypothetical protein
MLHAGDFFEHTTLRTLRFPADLAIQLSLSRIARNTQRLRRERKGDLFLTFTIAGTSRLVLSLNSRTLSNPVYEKILYPRHLFRCPSCFRFL